MIKEIEEEANEKIQNLDIALEETRNEQQELIGNQKDYEQRVTTKLNNYRQKLQVSQTEAQEATVECENLQVRLKKIERQKVTLQDENDRFRRQMNGRMGYDQAQYQELQREYNLLLEENQALKNASNNDEESYSGKNHALFEARESLNYLNGTNVHISSLSQLRTEYEEKIEELCDEKRQLIMKNSALITEEKRAVNRSWDLEVQLKDIQEKNTSLQLQIERLERSISVTSKKRVASKMSPRTMTKASERWRDSKMAKSCSSPFPKVNSLSSPTASTIPNVDIKSPEFQSSIKKFRTKLVSRLSSNKKKKKQVNSISQESLKNSDEEWEFHFD